MRERVSPAAPLKEGTEGWLGSVEGPTYAERVHERGATSSYLGCDRSPISGACQAPTHRAHSSGAALPHPFPASAVRFGMLAAISAERAEFIIAVGERLTYNASSGCHQTSGKVRTGACSNDGQPSALQT